MRISTSMMYDTGTQNLLQLQTGLYRLQNQLSTGRRILTPADDPVAAAQALVLTGPDGFRPTDAAALPDGRVVVVMRRLLWPLPMQFGAVIALVDPDRRDGEGRLVARQLVRLYPPIPVDNFEGVAVVRTGPGRVTLWVISDDNDAVTQRSLLLRFDLAPADLPPK